MALDASRLETAIKDPLRDEIVSKMDAQWPSTNIEDKTVRAAQEQQRLQFATVLAASIAKIVSTAVVSEIVTNAEVETDLNSNVLSVTSVSGVTPGTGSSGAGTGTLQDVTSTGSIT